jgi:hypothetical protein
MSSPWSWSIPNQRGIGTVLHGHRHLFRHFDFKELGVVSGPAWFGNFYDAHLVKGFLLGIEIRVFPISRQQWIADGVGVRRIGNIHRTADRLVATTLRNFAGFRTGHVVYKFNTEMFTGSWRPVCNAHR